MLKILYVCMCTCVSNFKSFLSLEVYTMMLYVIRATNISAKITLFYEEKGENFNLIFYTFFFSRECIFPHLEIVCLIRKEIICRSYSPPRGRNPAAQPCTSNLKQKNKHFYSRSLSNFHYFRPKFGLTSNSSFVDRVYVSTNRTTNFFFLKKKFFECFCLLFTQEKSLEKFQSLNRSSLFEENEDFEIPRLNDDFYLFATKGLNRRDLHYLAERSELTQQGRSESKVRDGVKKGLGGESGAVKKRKGFPFFPRNPFHPCLSPPAQGSSLLLFVEEMSIFYFPSRILSAAACSLSVSVHRESSVGREL